MPDDEQKPDDDKFRPEAIAERVERIGTETDADRLAHEEEQRLANRRREGKSALETAASKRLQRIGEGKVKRPVQAASPYDPATDGAARVAKWVQDHRVFVGGVAAAVLVIGGGALGYSSWQDQREADASVLLGQAFADDHGRVAAPAKEGEGTEATDEGKLKPLYPAFKSAAERRDAALGKYRQVEAKYPGTGAAILARLSEGGLLLDAGDAKGAKAALQDVRASALAKADAEVRGRAVEGIGFADELLAREDDAGKVALLGDALSVYKELEAVQVDGYRELGQYHQARVLAAQGDKAKAIELLKALLGNVSDPAQGHSYLQFAVEDRLRELDPSAVPPKPKPPRMGGGAAENGADMSDPKIQELIRQLQEKQKQGSGGASK